MVYTHVECLKDYFSPLDRSKILHIEGRTYQAREAIAEGFYSVDCEIHPEHPTSISLQVTDVDYRFKTKL
jgi:hypothetical protein